MIRRLRSWLQYRAEKRMLERNPYDYIRWVLDMPDATDEDLDAAGERMAEAMRQVGISASEVAAATATFADVVRLAGEDAEAELAARGIERDPSVPIFDQLARG